MIKDWTKNFGNNGKFLKGPKISMTQGLINENKKRPKPAPGSYPINNNIADNIKRKKTSLSLKAEKMCGFIEQAKW